MASYFMRVIALVTASPLFAFEMNVPCQASPPSTSSVRCGARARSRLTCAASDAMPPWVNVFVPLFTVSKSRWPWMSSVCRSWMRSSASVATVALGAAEFAGGTAAVHPTLSVSRRTEKSRRTAIDASGTRLPSVRGGFVRAVLELVEAVIDAALREEILVRPELHDAPLVQDDDAVDVLNGRETVGDDDRRPPDHQLRERVLDEVLRLGVHRARRLVEHEEDLGVERDRARERE